MTNNSDDFDKQIKYVVKCCKFVEELKAMYRTDQSLHIQPLINLINKYNHIELDKFEILETEQKLGIPITRLNFEDMIYLQTQDPSISRNDILKAVDFKNKLKDELQICPLVKNFITGTTENGIDNLVVNKLVSPEKLETEKAKPENEGHTFKVLDQNFITNYIRAFGVNAFISHFVQTKTFTRNRKDGYNFIGRSDLNLGTTCDVLTHHMALLNSLFTENAEQQIKDLGLEPIVVLHGNTSRNDTENIVHCKYIVGFKDDDDKTCIYNTYQYYIKDKRIPKEDKILGFKGFPYIKPKYVEEYDAFTGFGNNNQKLPVEVTSIGEKMFWFVYKKLKYDAEPVKPKDLYGFVKMEEIITPAVISE